ncbi:MFS transporter [Chelativorans sp. Marseille-P2723]|uniref:MFS transporter n=1 Tax=Chelativorans sp. Marseille-P2723 TaxID=2709133 RepID=UPI0015701B66|nr:MFS transporter [Chelativorans sp. Marseille-P2723]
MSGLRPLVPLLIAAGILLAGNGLMGTLIALRGVAEGFSPISIGIMGTAYFLGFVIGCLYIPRLLRSVGHIRAFAAMAALAATGTLLLVLIIDPYVWTAVRLLNGICFSSLFTIIESWLNSGAKNENRGRVLAIYRIIDIVAITGSQYIIPAVGVEGFTVFALTSMIITLSLVPVSIGDRSNPTPPAELRLDVSAVWQVSPLAMLGAITVGLTNGAFRMVGPVYADAVGYSVAEIVTFLNAGIIGGALMQYPLGALSDRWDRRYVILASTTAAAASTLAIFMLGAGGITGYALIFVFGSFAMPIYSLTAAHANDRATSGEYVQVAAGLILFYSTGAVVGPIAASLLMQIYGSGGLFAFIAAAYIIFILITLYRIGAGDAVPTERRGRFAALLRTSPIFIRMARRVANRENG